MGRLAALAYAAPPTNVSIPQGTMILVVRHVTAALIITASIAMARHLRPLTSPVKRALVCMAPFHVRDDLVLLSPALAPTHHRESAARNAQTAHMTPICTRMVRNSAILQMCVRSVVVIAGRLTATEISALNRNVMHLDLEHVARTTATAVAMLEESTIMEKSFLIPRIHADLAAA